MSLFEAIKNDVNLVDYVQKESGSTVKRTGETLRLNPCPICSHNDCFSLFPNDGSFHCFSCGNGGTVIDFELCHKGLKNPLEAAQSIARKLSIPIDQQTSKSNQSKTTQKSSQKKDTLPDKFISVSILKELERIPQKTIGYLKSKRGLSLEVIKKHKIGFNSWNKRITIPVYDEAGKLRNIRQYDPASDSNKMISWAKGYGSNRLFPISMFEIIRLSKLEEILICEGEPDCLAGLSHGLACVTATAGSGSWKKAWSELFKGLNVIICYDNDDSGKAGAQKVGNDLVRTAKSVEILQWPDSMGGGEDLTDWFVKHNKSVHELLSLPKVKVEKSQKKSQKRSISASSTEEDEYSVGGVSYHFSSFEVVAQDPEERVIFYSRRQGKLYFVTIRDLSLDKVCQIGGSPVKKAMVSTLNRATGKLDKGKIYFRDWKRWAIIRAGRIILNSENPMIGQGLSLLEDGSIVIVNGGDCLTYGGEKFTDYEKPLIGNQLLHRKPGRGWINSAELQDAVLSMNKEKAGTILKELAEIFIQWKFRGAFDTDVVVGWMVAQYIQDLWFWRPHLYISGRTETGKSRLLDTMSAIGGRLSLKHEGASLSEAGFRQSLGVDKKLCLIDEFERSPQREKLIEYFRSAGYGGKVAKGTQLQGKPKYFYIKHMVALGSIETGLSRAAERSRYIVTEMQYDPRCDPEIPNTERCNQLRGRIAAFGLWGGYMAKQLISQLGRIGGFDSRLVQAWAVPLSIFAITEPDPLAYLKDRVVNVLQAHTDSFTMVEQDEDSLLSDIATSLISVTQDYLPEGGTYSKTIRKEISISQALDNDKDPFIAEALEAHGIRRFPKDEGIFLNPNVISRKLLKDSPRWKGLQIRDILRRLPDAAHIKRYVAKRQCRGVLLQEYKNLEIPTNE